MDESSLVIERVNNAIVTDANLLQSAVHGILSKKAREDFTKIMRSLNVETRLIGSEEETGGGPPRLLPQGG